MTHPFLGTVSGNQRRSTDLTVRSTHEAAIDRLHHPIRRRDRVTVLELTVATKGDEHWRKTAQRWGLITKLRRDINSIHEPCDNCSVTGPARRCAGETRGVTTSCPARTRLRAGRDHPSAPTQTDGQTASAARAGPRHRPAVASSRPCRRQPGTWACRAAISPPSRRSTSPRRSRP